MPAAASAARPVAAEAMGETLDAGADVGVQPPVERVLAQTSDTDHAGLRHVEPQNVKASLRQGAPFRGDVRVRSSAGDTGKGVPAVLFAAVLPDVLLHCGDGEGFLGVRRDGGHPETTLLIVWDEETFLSPAFRWS